MLTDAELTDEYCTDFKAQKPVSTFTDNQGWYPGIEIRNGEDLFYRDRDASTVVPSSATRRTRPASSTRTARRSPSSTAWRSCPA